MLVVKEIQTNVVEIASPGPQGPQGPSGTQDTFKTIAVAGQSNIVADSPTDTLTVAAGSGISITTDASTDTITIASAGGAGTGDVVGPVSSTDHAIARFDLTTGKVIQNSTAILSDAGDIDTSSVTVDYAQLDVAATPAAAVGRVLWNATEGSAQLGLEGGNVQAVIGQQVYAKVRNGEATALSKGEVVYLFGASGNRATVKRAYNTSDLTSNKTFGIVAESIPSNQTGMVITQGVIDGISLGAPYVDGDILWLSSTPGQFTRTKPVQPNHLVFIGVVERASAGNGQIYVKPQNGYELDEIHDVLISSPQSGNVLIYDQPAGLWKNANLTDGNSISITEAPGAITIAVSDGDKGDITVSGSGATWTIDNGAVSLAKQANVATATVFYRKTAGTGAPEVQTLSTLKTDLGLTGTNSGDQTITLTNDVTGSGTGTFATTIANDAVTYAKMQNVSATDRLLGRQSAGAGDVEEITCTAAGRALLDDVDAAAQRTTLGLGTLATQSGTFSGTSSGTNTGDQSLFSTIAVSGQSNVVADSTSDTLTLVAGSNVTITTDASTDTITISSTGGGGGGISDGDKGDITVSGSGTTWTIDNDAVTYAKIQNVSTTDRLLGRQTAGAGDIEEVTCTAAGRALLDDVDAAAQRTTLGLGTLATQNGTFSGTSSGTNTGDQNLFSTIVVAGQSNVVADSASDTLTLVAGSNVTITTDASTDTITISSTGGGGGSLTDGDKGDITVSSSGTVWTIDNDAVTYAKIQNVSTTDRLLGRQTAGAGDVEEITCTSAGRALLDDVDAAAQRTTLGLGTLATQSGTFSGTSSGTNTGDQTITLTNDVTGSGTGSFATTIANDAVTYAKMQNVSATDRILGRQSTGSGDVEEITCTAAGRALLDDVDAAAQRTTLGLGTLATQSGTFSGTSSGTNTGDQNLFSTIAVSGQSSVVADATSDTLTLANGGSIAITTNATSDTVTIGVSDGDKGDITVSASGATWTIDNDAVTYAKMQNVTSNRLLGRSTAGAGDMEELQPGANLSISGGTVQVINVQKTITSGTAAPTGGVDGDIYLQYT